MTEKIQAIRGMNDTMPLEIFTTLIEAITQALAYEMTADKDVVILGEDVGVNGGVFRATTELFPLSWSGVDVTKKIFYHKDLELKEGNHYY